MRFFVLCLVVLSGMIGFFHQVKAQDATSTLVIFQMRDGTFYHPQTGKVAESREDMLRVLMGDDPLSRPSGMVANTSTGAAYLVESGLVSFASSTSLELNLPVSSTPSFVQRLLNAISRGQTMLREQIEEEQTSSSIGGSIARPAKNGWQPLAYLVWNPAREELIDVEPGSVDFLEENEVIVAGRYSRHVAHQVSKKRVVYTYQDMVYTPVTNPLRFTAFANEGKRQFDTLLASVYQELKQQSIFSATYPDRYLGDVIDRDLVLAVLLIEQSSTKTLSERPEKSLETFYLNFAANGSRAYARTYSLTGARGVAQFMPKTYKNLVQQRSELRLISNVEQGTQDVKNAMKAEIAYLDYLLSVFPERVRADYASSSDLINEFIVAAYNGGPARVMRVMDHWEESTKQLKALRKLEGEDADLHQRIRITKTKIGKTTVAKTKKKLKQELTSLHSRHAVVTRKIETVRNHMLKKETRDYLEKFRIALAYVRKEDTIASSLAMEAKNEPSS